MLVSKLIDAPPEVVWTILIDTRLWPVWGPSVNAVDCAQRYISAGTRGRVKTSLGPWLLFVITRFEEQNYWLWSVAGVTATGHRLKALGPLRCELSFELPVAAFPYGLLCRQATNVIERLASTAGQPASGEVDE